MLNFYIGKLIFLRNKCHSMLSDGIQICQLWKVYACRPCSNTKVTIITVYALIPGKGEFFDLWLNKVHRCINVSVNYTHKGMKYT